MQRTAQHGKCKAIITRFSARSIGLADIYAIADYYYGRARTSKRCHASFYRKVFSMVVGVHTCDTGTRIPSLGTLRADYFDPVGFIVRYGKAYPGPNDYIDQVK